MLAYDIYSLSVTDKEAFQEASREELRVLLALIEKEGKIDCIESLAKLSKTSKARASSALSFWNESGVIKELSDTPTITEEFEQTLTLGRMEETTAIETADAIRNSHLKDMITECAVLMKRAALNTSEIKTLTGLCEQYALSPEFVVTLAAHLSSNGTKLTVTKLVNKAIKLTESEIDSLKALEDYIIERENTSAVELELRRIFGIYDRALSKSEKESFNKWAKKYGYFTDIISEAYDKAASSVTRGYVSYADKLLTTWYEAGCRTLEECKAKYEMDKAERKKAQEEKRQSRTTVTAKKPKPRYGDFDPEEAFQKALERSYGKD